MSVSPNGPLASVLSEVLSGPVLQPGSNEYNVSNSSYFSAFENEIMPAYIVRPIDAQEVSRLFVALRPYVLQGQCRFAIRGAGHTPHAGAANVQNGVTIDTRGLKGIQLSQDKSIVNLGAGETWSNVYSELEKENLTVPGLRGETAGVAGSVLGGGLSFFSNRHGFVCDSVVDFEVILGTGEIVHANANENRDLWVALKGGSSNFGLVTSLQMKTMKSEKMWGGLVYYTADTFAALLKETCDFIQKGKDENVHIMCSAGFGFGHEVVTCVMYHTKGNPNPPELKCFTELEGRIPQADTLRTSDQLEFCSELHKFSTNGQRQFWASITIKPDIDLIKELHDAWQQILALLKDIEGFIFTFGFHPLSKTLLEKSVESGPNALGLVPSDGPLLVILINPIWANIADDSRVFPAIETFMEDLRKKASERNLLHRYIFMNYAYSQDNVMGGCGEVNVAKLWEVSRKYDPEGIFQTGNTGGFKLSVDQSSC